MKPFTFQMYNMYTASKHMYEKLTPLYDDIVYAEGQIHDESTTGDFEEITHSKHSWIESIFNWPKNTENPYLKKTTVRQHNTRHGERLLGSAPQFVRGERLG